MFLIQKKLQFRAYVRQAYFLNILYAHNVENLGFWRIVPKIAF